MSSGSAGLYLVSLVLAWGIVTLIGLLLGLLAFWTVEIWGFVTIRYIVSQFFGGALVPLWFFPASVLLGRTGELAIPPLLSYCAPLVGFGLFALAYRLWSRQLWYYESAGH